MHEALHYQDKILMISVLWYSWYNEGQACNSLISIMYTDVEETKIYWFDLKGLTTRLCSCFFPTMKFSQTPYIEFGQPSPLLWVRNCNFGVHKTKCYFPWFPKLLRIHRQVFMVLSSHCGQYIFELPLVIFLSEVG